MKKLTLFALIALLCACHRFPTTVFKGVNIKITLAESGKVIKDQTISGSFTATGPDENGVIDIVGKDPEMFTVDLNTTQQAKDLELLTIKMNGNYTQYAVAKGHQLAVNGSVDTDKLAVTFGTQKLEGLIRFTK